MYGAIDGSFKHFVVGASGWLIAVLSFIGFLYLFKRIKMERAIQLLFLLAFLVVLYGSLEFLFKMSGPLAFVFHLLSSIFSGKISNRIILTTSEPSWAIQLLIFLVPFIFYTYKVKGIRKSHYWYILALIIIVFAGCLSFTGLAIIFFSVLFYSLINFKSSVKYLLLVAFLSSAILMLLNYYLTESSDTLPYYLSRVLKLKNVLIDNPSLGFNAILSIDDSILVRLGYPYVAFEMFLDHPFGIGVGQFGNYFEKYLYLLNGVDYSTSEVVKHIAQKNADPRNFYLKVFVENGIFLGVLFLIFLGRVLYQVKNTSDKNLRVLFTQLFCISLAIMMQFSTAYFSVYWLTFAFIFIYSSETNERQKEVDGQA